MGYPVVAGRYAHRGPDVWKPRASEQVVAHERGRMDLHQLAQDLEVQGAYWEPGLSWSPDGTKMARHVLRRRCGPADEDGPGPPTARPEPALRFATGTLRGRRQPGLVTRRLKIAFESTTTDGMEVWLVTNADGTGEVREIDELRYLSWRGGWDFCMCYR